MSYEVQPSARRPRVPEKVCRQTPIRLPNFTVEILGLNGLAGSHYIRLQQAVNHMLAPYFQDSLQDRDPAFQLASANTIRLTMRTEGTALCLDSICFPEALAESELARNVVINTILATLLQGRHLINKFIVETTDPKVAAEFLTGNHRARPLINVTVFDAAGKMLSAKKEGELALLVKREVARLETVEKSDRAAAERLGLAYRPARRSFALTDVRKVKITFSIDNALLGQHQAVIAKTMSAQQGLEAILEEQTWSSTG